MKAVVVLFAMFMLYKGVNLVLEDVSHNDPIYLLKQQDYGTYDTASFELAGETFYYPTEGDRVGYYPFPAATYDLTGKVRAMGQSIKDGFETIN